MSKPSSELSQPTSEYNQPIEDPIAHFEAIPWCEKLLSHKSVVGVTVPDRTPTKTTEGSLARITLNTPETVKASILFFRYFKPTAPAWETGEDKKSPFLEVNAFADFGTGLNGYANTAQGGFFGVVLDEVMGTAANMQAVHGAYTAWLKVDFKKPLYTPCVVLIKGKVVKKAGRKLTLQGSLEDKDGNVIAKAEGLWLTVDRDIGRTNAKL